MLSKFTKIVAAAAIMLAAAPMVMNAGKVQTIPGTVSLGEGTYSGAKTENNNDNVGYIKNGCYATYGLNCTEAGVYDMVFAVSRINGGTMTLTITDKATNKVEATTIWEIPMADNRDYIDRTVRIADRIETGEKTLKLLFNSDQSSWVCNYKAMTFTKYAENSASINSLKVNGTAAEKGGTWDWAANIPNIYSGTTVTLAPEAKNAVVTASAKNGEDNANVDVTKNADGTFSLPVPAPGAETIVTFTIAADGAGVLPVKETYTLRLFRIGEDKVTELTVDGTPLSPEALETLNSTGKFDLTGWIFTAYPTVKALMVDNTTPEVSHKETATSATYSFTGTGGKQYSISIADGFHFYTPASTDLTTTLRYSDAGVTAEGWSNGSYSISTVNSGWGGTQFKYKTGVDYTLTIPSDVVVKQFIFGQLGDNYEQGSVGKVSSEGATVYLPTSTVFYPGDKTRYDLKVNLEGHKAGTPIVFSFAKGSQPVAWIDLVYEKQALTTTPVLLGSEQTPTEKANHAIVTLTFDREMTDTEATVAGQTVRAEGGTTRLRFAVWDLAYGSKNSLTIAAGAAKDNYGNSNTQAISIPINVGPEPAVEAIPEERIHVVSDVAEWKAALAAVNAANAKAGSPRSVIFVRNGSYDFGAEEQTFRCHNVSVIGESRTGVILHGNRSGISNPVISTRYASGTYFQDLTMRSDLDFGTGKRNGVGVALYGGAKDILVNVTLQSYQDTYVTGSLGYYENCDIHGVVDYICGGGSHYFYRCNLINEMGGTITAPSTDASLKFGYVFESCTIKGVANCNLGRPWQNNPAAAFLNTVMEAPASAKGWESMGTLPTRFYEFNSVDKDGKAIDLSARKNSPTSTNKYDPVLTAEEAAAYTLHNVVGLTDSWLPTEGIAPCEAPANVKTADGVLSWDKVAGATYYVVFADGKFLAAVSGNKLDLSTVSAAAETTCSVRAANAMGGLGRSAGGPESSITGIEAGSDEGETEYFNLQGIRVANPSNGIFIRRQGGKTAKVIVR